MFAVGNLALLSEKQFLLFAVVILEFLVFGQDVFSTLNFGLLFLSFSQISHINRVFIFLENYFWVWNFKLVLFWWRQGDE